MRVRWSRVMVTSPLVLVPLEVRVTPLEPLAAGPWGSGSLPLPLLGVAVLFLGGGAAGGGQGDLDSSVGGSGFVGGVLDLGLALALAGHAGLPLVQLGELLELGFDGVGAFLREGLVVGVVLDVVGVAHDGECAAVGVLVGWRLGLRRSCP